MQRRIKSFVLRAGRMSPRQQLGVEQHLSQYCLPATDIPWDLTREFSREADTVVEIGFGMGGSLLEMAAHRPDINFIGIEVHQAGIGALAADLHALSLTNLRIAPYDAVEIFKHNLVDASLAGIQIFFPDPWPKKRHHKRRLIQAGFVDILFKKLRPGGFIHCATDWQDYAEQILATLTAQPGLRNQYLEGDFTPRPNFRPMTKFEQRGIGLGHKVWDLIFIREV